MSIERIQPFRNPIGTFIVLMAICTTVAGQQSESNQHTQFPPSDRPNIVLINIDDADADLLRPQMLQDFYPNIRDMAASGIRFTNMHATTPFCAPSRAALFRGQYAFSTGVKVNEPENTGANGFTGGYGEFLSRGYDRDELGVWMKNAGYRTMHVGKFHHHHFDNRVPPGWNEFRMTAGARYHGSFRFSNANNPAGEWFQTGQHEYVTTVDGDDAVELINQQAFSGQPFFLYVAPIAPHSDQSNLPEDMVEVAYANFADGHVIENSPDLEEADVSDKPKHLRFNTPDHWREYNRRSYISRVRAMKSVDDLVGRITGALDAINATGNTYVFLTSDNGFQLGHHNLQNKTDPYQRTSNVPLLVTGPGVPANRSASHLLAHIDLCPTILALAQAPIPSIVEAKSFAPLLIEPNDIDEESWQDGIMLENWAKKSNYGRDVVGSYVAWRQHHEVFVSWANGQYEYYDLNSDPFQLDNAWNELSLSRRQELKREVRRFRSERIDPITTLDKDFESRRQSSRVKLRGYCEDDSGVFGTVLTMKSFTTNRYWNGQTWQDDWYGHYLPVKNTNQPISTWLFNTEVQSETPSGTDYLVFTYRSYDSDGAFPQTVSFHVNEIDSAAPIASFADEGTLPSFAGQVQLSGPTFDAVEFDKALLTIRQNSSGRYWNGLSFQADRFEIAADAEVEGQWQFTGTLPRGHYRASLRGVDSVGNKQKPAKSLRFRVE